MIVESKDLNTGIIRFEVNTVNPEACRGEIESSGCIKEIHKSSTAVRYIAKYRDCEIEIRSTPTRTILFGLNRYAMLEFLDKVKGSESKGTAWAYDDSKKSDYEK